MNSAFKFGVISSSFLLIKLHLLIALIINVILIKIFDVETMATIVAMAYLLIVGIGHVRCSFNSFSQIHNPHLFNKPLEEPENFDDAIIKKNHAVLGLFWRITQEWLYLKKTANFDFKSTS